MAFGFFVVVYIFLGGGWVGWSVLGKHLAVSDRQRLWKGRAVETSAVAVRTKGYLAKEN